MKNDDFLFLKDYVRTVREPENLFSGTRLPANFALPDNILIFFHDFTSPAPDAHGRHTLVFPLEKMIYFVERKRVELAPGMMLYVPPYALRFLHPDSAGYGRFFITFEVGGAQPYLPEPGAFELTDEAWLKLRSFLNCFSAGVPDRVSVTLVDFFNSLPNIRKDAVSESGLPENLLRVIELIETSLSAVPDIAPLAVRAGLSESHLRALFRRYMGISIGKFISGKKIDYARFALSSSDLSIAEIAEGAGFANIYVFSTFFKRNTGISPARFRKQMQQQNKNKGKVL